MTNFMDRLPMLVELRTEGGHRETIRRNAADPVKDLNGCCSTSLADDLRFFGVADYLLKGDVRSFQSQLSDSANVRCQLFERFEAGEPIDGSYVTMLSCKDLFNALAAANMTLSVSLAQHMGGREGLEREHDHPFDYAMGYTLRAFVLRDAEQMQKWPPKLAAVCRETNMVDFEGYTQVFNAILLGDTVRGQNGLEVIVRGHQKQSKGNGVFANTEDEILCVWGIGMTNLARSFGLSLQGISPLIPSGTLQ